MTIRGTEVKGVKLIATMRADTGRIKKVAIIMAILAIVLCAIFWSEKQASIKRTMVEENDIKYYFRGDSGDYSFDGARWLLTVKPYEDIITKAVNNEVRLSIWYEGGDIWRVTYEKNTIEKPEYKWHSTDSFRSGSDFSEETLVEERDFHSNYKRSFYMITERYATPEYLRQIIENGELICAGLNAGNAEYLDKACIVTE